MNIYRWLVAIGVSKQEIKMPEIVKSSDKPEDYYGIDLDGVLSELGEFGKFQKIIYVLTFLPVILDSCLCMSYIFTTAQVDYR